MKTAIGHTNVYSSYTQGNIGVKKIARSRFQPPVKKENRKLRHWRPTARSLHAQIIPNRYTKYEQNPPNNK
jgi:hypothetical protein